MASGPSKAFDNQIIIFLVSVLQDSPLDLFFTVSWDMNGLHAERVKAGIIHAGRCTHRCGSKVLDLLGVKVVVPDIFRKQDHVLDRAAGVP